MGVVANRCGIFNTFAPIGTLKNCEQKQKFLFFKMNKKIVNGALATLLLLAAACSTDGYEESKGDVRYRFVEENPKAAQPAIGDVLDISVRVYATDTVLLNKRMLFSLDSVRFEEQDLHEVLALMHEGDSANFVFEAQKFYTNSFKDKLPARIAPDQELFVDVRLHSFKKKEAIERERQAFANQSKLEEQTEIDKFLASNNIQAKPKDGIYCVVSETGKGPALKAEQKVTVHYTGAFLNGQVFDSSYERNEPFVFTLGIGEVIEAWDLGLKNARVGDKLRIIAPSSRAYGSDGYEGFVPPYTPLYFEIEVLDAQ